jgi:hypothetical protein
MSDFATRTSTPSASEYLAASDAELLDRLNRNPTGLESEFPFLRSVIAVRAAESQRKTNEALVRQTRLLVYATRTVCVATIITALITALCR